VYLERDVSETDQFDRLLRYVWLPDGRMLNYKLVFHGYAHASTFPPDVKYADRFLEAQRDANANGRGLWSGCAATATLVPAPLAPPQQGNCDPSYPTVCIPPPPPDLDCSEIPYRRFELVGSDPRGFDGDRDGIGCES
jgi:micrococcal nuclease